MLHPVPNIRKVRFLIFLYRRSKYQIIKFKFWFSPFSKLKSVVKPCMHAWYNNRYLACKFSFSYLKNASFWGKRKLKGNHCKNESNIFLYYPFRRKHHSIRGKSFGICGVVHFHKMLIFEKEENWPKAKFLSFWRPMY